MEKTTAYSLQLSSVPVPYCFLYTYTHTHTYTHIYISCTVDNRENTSKNSITTTVAVFKGHNSECDLQQNIMTFDVSWLMYVRLLVHMQKEESKVNIAGTV